MSRPYLTALRRRLSQQGPAVQPPPIPAGWQERLRIETCDTTDPYLDDLAQLTADLGDPRAAAMRIAGRRRSRP